MTEINLCPRCNTGLFGPCQTRHTRKNTFARLRHLYGNTAERIVPGVGRTKFNPI